MPLPARAWPTEGTSSSLSAPTLRATTVHPPSQPPRRPLFRLTQRPADVAAVFRSTAEGETGHAHGHLEFLQEVGDPCTNQPIGDTVQNLNSAIIGQDRPAPPAAARGEP